MRNSKGQFVKGNIPWIKGNSQTEEAIEKNRKKHLGKKHTKKTIEKMRITHKNEKNSGRFKDGNIPWHKGKKDKGICKPTIGSFKKGHKTWNKGLKSSTPAWNKGLKCPQFSGENSPSWQGGITEKNHKIRTSLEYKLWRKAVFERDNFTCQKTGISGGILHSHHINNFADYPELRLAIDNGIALSKKSHREFHKIYGKRNNTREQLNEFLNK